MRKRSSREKNGGGGTRPSIGEPEAGTLRRNWWRWLLAAIVVGCGILAGVLIGRGPATNSRLPGGAELPSHQTGAGPGRLSPTAAAEMLALPPDVPQTAEALKEEATRVCRRLAADLADRPESHALAALTYKRFGRTAQALECWQTSLEINPRFSPAYFGMASVAADKADHDQAEALLRKAIRLNPRLPGAHNLLVEVLLDQGKADEALSVALEHRDLFPKSHEGYFWLGQAYVQLKDYQSARKAHQQAIAIDPDFTLSYHSLAILCARLGDKEKAGEYRRKFAGLKEGDLERERGRNKLYRDVASQRQTVANTHLCAGNVYRMAGFARKAEAHWVRAAAVDPKDTACREALATLYEEQNRLSDALGAREDLLALEPENVDQLTGAAALCARLNQFDQAEAAFRRAMELAPERAGAYLGLVKLYLQADRNLPEAARLAAKAVDLEPSARNYVLLSAVLDESGDQRGAMAAIERAIELEPDDPVPRQIRELFEKNRR